MIDAAAATPPPLRSNPMRGNVEALNLEEQHRVYPVAQPAPSGSEALLVPRQVDRLISDCRIAVAELRQAGHAAERAGGSDNEPSKDLVLQTLEPMVRREAQAISRILSYEPRNIDEALARADFLFCDDCAVHWWECGPSEEHVALLVQSMAKLNEPGWQAED